MTKKKILIINEQKNSTHGPRDVLHLLGLFFNQFVIPYGPKDIDVDISWAISMPTPPPVAVTWQWTLVAVARLWH